eukprot:5893901-Alexandrium_andersonii.AAC.1
MGDGIARRACAPWRKHMAAGAPFVFCRLACVHSREVRNMRPGTHASASPVASGVARAASSRHSVPLAAASLQHWA